MANSTDNVNVQFGADVKGLTSGLSQVTSQVEQALGQMKGGFSSLGSAIETAISNPLIAATAALAGFGLVIGTAVSKTTEMSREAFNFAAVMGTTTAQASALKQALEEIGLSTDTYSNAFLKFVRQVKNNGSDLEKNFGLKLRDINGNLRDGNVLFQEALAKVFEYKAGIDQDTVAMALFGKSVSDVIKLQRLNNEALEEAKIRNQELGLTITDQNVAAYQAWEKASNDAGDVFEALWKTIGDAFIPILTELANWFASVGPTAVEITRVALAALAGAFYAIETAAVAIVAPIEAAMSSIASAARNAAAAIANVASLDFSAAKANIKQIGTDTVNAFAEADKKIVDQAVKTKNAVKQILSPDMTSSAPKGGVKSAPNLEKGGGGRGKSAASQLAEEEVRHQEAMQNELLNQKRAIAQSELNLGMITKAQLIQQEIDFENESYEIKRQAMEKRTALLANDPNTTPAAKQKALDQMLEMEQQHETAVLKLKLQAAEEAQKFNMEAAKTIENSFQDLFQSVISGQKSLSEAFNDFINSIVSALSKLAAQYLAQALFGGGAAGSGFGLGGIISGIFGGGGGGGGSLIGSGFGFGGFLASGGDVEPGTSYIVGEKGPETFVPRVPGTIVPNTTTGGKKFNVVNNFLIQGTMNQQSQQQIAASVGISINRASRRNN